MQYNILDILRHLRGGNMGKIIEYETPKNCSDCKFYREINDNQYGICEYFEKILKKNMVASLVGMVLTNVMDVRKIMKLIKLARRKGKTTRLINKAHNQPIYIICSNKERAYEISEMASRMNKDILFPICLDELISYGNKGNHVKQYLIDDLDDIVQTLIYRYLIKPLISKGEILEITATKTDLADLIGATYEE